MILNKEELLQINGGSVTITATLLNSLTKGITIIGDLGRSLGSAIRRIVSGKICEVN